MLGLDGTWYDNSSCKKCRYRHPAGWSCAYASFVARKQRDAIASWAIPDTTNWYLPEQQTADPWEYFIQENYLS